MPRRYRIPLAGAAVLALLVRQSEIVIRSGRRDLQRETAAR
jgi:hypothetical protein